MKKKIKFICWVLFVLLILLTLNGIVANGNAGDRAQYYYFKGKDRIFNSQNKPCADFVIDLNQSYDFILKNAQSDQPVGFFGWWPAKAELVPYKERLGLRVSTGNPFERLKVKIILNDTTLIIPNAKVIVIEFKDYRSAEYRVKYPLESGIDSIQIFWLEEQTTLENGRISSRRTDYAFSLAQHQKLVTMFSDPKFIRDADADEIEKNIANERLGSSKHLEYKTWAYENFTFTLTLTSKHANTDYCNSIFIDAKDQL